MPPPTSRPRVLFIAPNANSLARPYGKQISAIAEHCHIEMASPPLSPALPLEPGEILPDMPHHAFFLRRKGPHPSDLLTVMALTALIKRVQPDLVHLIGTKPIVYGGLALRVLWRHMAMIATFPGLGPAFIEDEDGNLKRPVLSRLGGAGFRMALHRRRVRAIFQNSENAALFEDRGYIRRGAARVVPGSGIDLEKFHPAPHIPDGPPLVVLITRLLRSKGVLEFAEAAQELRESEAAVRFAIIGRADANNPDSLTEPELRHLEEDGCVEMWGWSQNVAQVLNQAHIVCLPSRYPEGIPRILMEAAACGLPTITTDTPGCREAVVDGVTGLFVPPRDAHALAEAISTLLRDPERAAVMGRAGRARAKKLFGDDRIVARTLAVYQELLERDFFPDAKAS